MRGGARAKRAHFFSSIFICVVEGLETKAVTCTQLSSCSQAYMDFKWVCFICQICTCAYTCIRAG